MNSDRVVIENAFASQKIDGEFLSVLISKLIELLELQLFIVSCTTIMKFGVNWNHGLQIWATIGIF